MTSTQLPPSPQMGQQQQQQGLPPTGIQQQLTSLNNLYQGAQQGPGGFDPRQQQFAQAQMSGGGWLQGPSRNAGQVGSSSLDQMARNLAQRYGLPIGRGRLVDDQGNFMVTPEQLANASGGQVTLGEAASQMNYISQAIQRQRQEQDREKGVASLQTGLGLVQSRGRGSLAGMMSGYYQNLASLYQAGNYEVADFSYYIQKEQMDIQREMQRRQERQQRRRGRFQMLGGLGMTIGGIASGNVGLIGMGAGNLVGGAAESGWF